jgi:hypothetical protein
MATESQPKQSSKGLTFLQKVSSPSMQLDSSKFGYPGIKSELHILATREDELRTDEERFDDISLRDFIVSGRLSKAPIATDTIKGDFTELDGNSYFLFDYSIGIKVEMPPHGAFEIRKNAGNEASFVSLRCRAKSTNEAKAIFLKACAPFLDFMSYRTVCPVYIVGIRVEDPSNLHTSIELIQPYKAMTIGVGIANLAIPLKPVYALYRESICSYSELYKFLCLYKIMEGYFKKLKPELYKACAVSRVTISKKKDLVPDHKEIPESVRSYIGKSITLFMDEVLTPRFRDAVAHFSKEGESPLITSDPAHLARYAEILLISELCARQVIATYEDDFRFAQTNGVDMSRLLTAATV